MSGPYRVENHPRETCSWKVIGPGGAQIDCTSWAEATWMCKAVTAAYAAGLAASGREAELVKALEQMESAFRARCNHCGGDVHICDGHAWSGGCIAPEARALTPTDDREYREAVEKLMKEPG